MEERVQVQDSTVAQVKGMEAVASDQESIADQAGGMEAAVHTQESAVDQAGGTEEVVQVKASRVCHETGDLIFALTDSSTVHPAGASTPPAQDSIGDHPAAERAVPIHPSTSCQEARV
jgi:hypothetical protein